MERRQKLLLLLLIRFSILSISIIIIILGNEVSHVGLVDHKEGDRDGLLPAQVCVYVPEDEIEADVECLNVNCWLASWLVLTKMHEEGNRYRLLLNQVPELLSEDEYEDELTICTSQRLIGKELAEWGPIWLGPVNWRLQESKMKVEPRLIWTKTSQKRTSWIMVQDCMRPVHYGYIIDYLAIWSDMGGNLKGSWGTTLESDSINSTTPRSDLEENIEAMRLSASILLLQTCNFISNKTVLVSLPKCASQRGGVLRCVCLS